MKLNEKIKQLRIDNNITQRELAQKLGVSIPTLQKYEYGTLKIKSEILIKMCDIFQIELNELTKFLEKEDFKNFEREKKIYQNSLLSKSRSFQKEKDFEDNLKILETLSKFNRFSVQRSDKGVILKIRTGVFVEYFEIPRENLDKVVFFLNENVVNVLKGYCHILNAFIGVEETSTKEMVRMEKGDNGNYVVIDSDKNKKLQKDND
jgi:transcriptional regulator, XRE family|nr:MAG TPA: helix-turn-helix domain protein [Caudoviricetes sp.]